MAKKMKNTIVLAGIQTAAGVGAVLTATNALRVRNVTMTPIEQELVALDFIRGYYGNSKQLPVTEFQRVQFEVPIAGGGEPGAKPVWGILHRACAHAETVTADTNVKYNPITENIEFATLDIYMDKVFHHMTDCVGTVTTTLTAKGLPVYQYTFTGVYHAISDKPNVVVTDFNDVDPVPFGKRHTPAWSIFGYTGCLQSITFDMANTVVWRSLVMCEGADITDRAPTGSIIMELPTIAGFDWPEYIRNAETGILTVTHGTEAGNIVMFTLNVQLTTPTYSDQDGIIMLNATLNIQPITGNDEVITTVS